MFDREMTFSRRSCVPYKQQDGDKTLSDDCSPSGTDRNQLRLYSKWASSWGEVGLPWGHTYMAANCPWARCWTWIAERCFVVDKWEEMRGTAETRTSAGWAPVIISQIAVQRIEHWLHTTVMSTFMKQSMQHTVTYHQICKNNEIFFMWVWGKHIRNLILSRMLGMIKAERHKPVGQRFQLVLHKLRRCCSAEKHWNMNCLEGNWGKKAVSIST